MGLTSLLLATLFVAPPVAAEPDPEPGMGRDAYGDAMPFGAVARYGTLRFRGGYPGGVAFSRDGKTIISAGSGDNLHFWDADTGKLVRKYAAFSSHSHQFARSPDGKQIATGNYHETDVRLRDLQTGKIVRRLKGLKAPPIAIWFSPDGKLIAASEFQTDKVVVWNRATGIEIARLELRKAGLVGPQTAYTIAFSQDGKYFAIGDLEVFVYEVENWNLVKRFSKHKDHILSVAFTPDNAKVIIGAADWTLRVWDLASEKEVRRIAEEVAGSVAVTRDGKTAIGNDKEMRLTAWSLETGKTVYRSSARITAGRFILSEDETRLVGWSGSAVIVYDARTGKCLSPMPVPEDPARMISFSPNGRLLAIAYKMRDGVDVRVWGFNSGIDVRHSGSKGIHPMALRVNDDRTVVLYGIASGGGAELWNLTAKKRTPLPSNGDGLPTAVFANGGRVYSVGKELIQWDMWTDRIERRVPLPPNLSRSEIVISGDERVLLALGGRNREAKSWSAITGKELSSITLDYPDSVVSLSPDGKHFVTRGDKTACIRNTRDGVVVHDFEGDRVRAATFSPDGRLIATAYGPESIQLWDAKSLKRVRRIEGHDGWISHLLFSPDGRYLASVSSDTTILVWDVRKLVGVGK